jgi:exo-beta-1,3-glucanase (GH17 family)
MQSEEIAAKALACEDRPIHPDAKKARAGFGAPLALLLACLAIIAAVWFWMGRAVTLAVAPIDPTNKVDCVSYAPFREHQSPWNSDIVISPAQITEDLIQLAGISKCIRTYSVENGLDKVPELAAKVGLKVMLGIWLGRDPLKNARLVDTAVALAQDYPDVVTSVMVGSEVLLRGEMTAADLHETIRAAKARLKVRVSYADSWDYWLRYPELGNDVDFITVHMLPYWEDVPIRAEDAAEHVENIQKRVAQAFPGKEILIGEVGWPSRGRMREVSLPSRVNQARFISDMLVRARQGGYRFNLFEAYDEPWKRQWEGTVGAYWGLFDGISREPKYTDGAAVSNYPFWNLQLIAGLVFSGAVFAVALVTVRRRRSATGVVPWLAVATSATVGGILLGLAAEKTLYESYGFAGWSFQILLFAVAIAQPLLCAHAMMAKRSLPALVELFGPHDDRTRSLDTLILGAALTVTIMVTTETALGLVFDPRSRDFPFASLTMAVVPLWMVAQLNPGRADVRRVAEAVFACLLVAAAVFLLVNEGLRNWQSMWVSAAYAGLGFTLYPARAAAVSIVAGLRVVSARLFGKDERDIEPVAVDALPPANSQGAAGGFTAAVTPRMECDR